MLIELLKREVDDGPMPLPNVKAWRVEEEEERCGEVSESPIEIWLERRFFKIRASPKSQSRIPFSLSFFSIGTGSIDKSGKEQ